MCSNGTWAKAVQQEKRNSTRSFIAGLVATPENGSDRRDQQRKGGNHRRASEFLSEAFSNCGVRSYESCKSGLADPSTESRTCPHSDRPRGWFGPSQWSPP